MAKYEDYAPKGDELESEIKDAGDQTTDRQEAAGQSEFEMPDRFKDKSTEEIAASYAELEKAYSRQGNDLGKMRSTMDEFLTLQSAQPQAPEAPQEPEPITVDEFYDDPNGTIQRAVELATTDKIGALEQELAQAKLETRVGELSSKHEGWQDTVQTPEFQNWVMESPYRQRLAQAADGWDLDAAEDLLGMYGEATGAQSAAERAALDAQLDNATLETGSASVPAQEQTFSRSDLTNRRTRALQGDYEQTEWLKTNSDAIAIAYEQGNITD